MTESEEPPAPPPWYRTAVETAIQKWNAAHPDASFPLSNEEFGRLTALISRHLEEAQGAHEK